MLGVCGTCSDAPVRAGRGRRAGAFPLAARCNWVGRLEPGTAQPTHKGRVRVVFNAHVLLPLAECIFSGCLVLHREMAAEAGGQAGRRAKGRRLAADSGNPSATTPKLSGLYYKAPASRYTQKNVDACPPVALGRALALALPLPLAQCWLAGWLAAGGGGAEQSQAHILGNQFHKVVEVVFYLLAHPARHGQVPQFGQQWQRQRGQQHRQRRWQQRPAFRSLQVQQGGYAGEDAIPKCAIRVDVAAANAAGLGQAVAVAEDLALLAPQLQAAGRPAAAFEQPRHRSHHLATAGQRERCSGTALHPTALTTVKLLASGTLLFFTRT